jgi:hypothetical protein
MANTKCSNTVSRQEFYSTVALLFFLPALLFVVSGSFPDTLETLRQVAAVFVYLAMIGLGLAYSIMAKRERSRQAKEKDTAA